MAHDPLWCPTFSPDRKDFERPFADFVREIFAKDPDLPAFKVKPPAGWKARRRLFPELKHIQIATPIRQHAFGSKGSYRCILVEQKGLNAAEFKEIAEQEEAAVPSVQKKLVEAFKIKPNEELTNDDMMEREFWNSVTVNPPLYGADTPLSFFDPKLGYGWNVRNLGDLLKQEGVPAIQGVTTPMTYFGMWRSFFAWHKEDADLQSINFLHWGAAKVWYCVSPKDRAKFERMVENTFPNQRTECPAFIRHKDTLISPAMLRLNGINYMQAKQYPGEFIVLNAAAYHCGYNLGFNCAEAINFATPEWIPVGKQAVQCTCDAMRDGVRISMKLFDPEWRDPSDVSSQDMLTSSSKDTSSSYDTADEGEEGHAQHSHSKGCSHRHAKAAPAGAKKAGGVTSVSSAGVFKKSSPPNSAPQRRQAAKSAASLARSKAVAAALGSKRSSPSRDRAGSAKKPRTANPAAKKPAAVVAKSTTKPVAPARKPRPVAPPPEARIKLVSVGGRSRGRGGSMTKLAHGLTATLLKEAIRVQASREQSLKGGPAKDAESMATDTVVGPPLAILGVDRSVKTEDGEPVKIFGLVQRLKSSNASTSAKKGKVLLRWLREGGDGLYRPVPIYWEASPEALLTTIRTKRESGGEKTEAVSGGSCWKLLTPQKLILETELADE